MKKLGLILICLMLFSCIDNEQEYQEKMENWKDYAVIVIDSPRSDIAAARSVLGI